MNKIVEFTKGIPMTVAGAVFLIIGYITGYGHLGHTEHVNSSFPFNFCYLAVLICGISPVYNAIKKLIFEKGLRKISGALLVSVAMIASLLTGEVFACGEIAFIMALGNILEDLTVAKAQRGIKEMINLSPSKARVIKNNMITEVETEKLVIGDMVRVLPGEAFPIDGRVDNGHTTVNEAIMTGESLPVEKVKGDSVLAGTINMFGAVDILVTKEYKDTSLQKLIKLVSEADEKKAPREVILDKMASILVPASFLLSIIAYFITKDIKVSVTLLVVFCPCALILATPTAIMAAIGQATKNRVMIKSGQALENVNKVDTVVFDKTGTLTYGELSVKDIVSLSDEHCENCIIRFALACEENSEHPIGKAIFNYGALGHIETKNFKMTPGGGVSVNLDGETIYCGNESYLSENGILINNDVKEKLNNYRNEGYVIVLVAKEKELVGIITLMDTVKPNIKEVIDELKSMNVEPYLLTGDHEIVGKRFANTVGIDKVYGDLLPEQKLDYIKKLQKEGKTVCMVGDGVNDAPALKTSDVGIAMGLKGSNITLDASDIAIMTDDISLLTYLKKLSRATIKTINFGVALSLTINLCAIILSFMRVLNPTTGALVHNGGSCLVILIAGFLYDRKFIKNNNEFATGNNCDIKKKVKTKRTCCCG